jgi:prepilin-type N-terminal cleavage/methylation domain-containing protein
MKKNKIRGFTLVELIVVLVILAILAALLVPALTGYIDKAKKNQVIAETRMLTQAAQTELSSLYATDEFAKQNISSSYTIASKDETPLPLIGGDKQLLTNLKDRYNSIVKLSEVPSLNSGTGNFAIWADKSGKITFTFYRDGKGYTGIYSAEDGSIEAFKDVDVPEYDTFLAHYKNKVVCQPLTQRELGEVHMLYSKNNVFAFLGIGDYIAQ